MRCPRCEAPLIVVDQVREGRTRQIWAQCPMCNLCRTVSAPDARPAPRRIGRTYRFSAGLALVKPRSESSA